MIVKITLRIIVWGVCLAAVTAFSTPVANAGSRVASSLRGGAAKQSCSRCQDAGNSHLFGEVGAVFDCQACNSCHTNSQAGWCQEYHCSCNVEEDATLTALRLADVAASADWKFVAGFLAEHVNRVHYNSGRGVLQLVSCDGGVQAQYPVSDAVALTLN